MKMVTASEARTHVTGKPAHAVHVSKGDRRAFQETLHLLSIPEMRASIRKGMKTPVKECLESLDE